MANQLTMLDIALKYAEYEFKPFPMVPNSKNYYKGSNGFLDGTSEKNELMELFNRYGVNSNIGLNMAGTMYVVLDIDQHGDKDGFKSLELLEKQFGALPPTYTVATTTGNGEHRYFFINGISIDKNITDFREGIDILGTHVNAPPSQVAGTNGYTVKSGKLADIAQLPIPYFEEIVRFYQQSQKPNFNYQVNYQRNGGKWKLAQLMEEMANGISSGGRNDFACKIYGSLLRTGMDPGVAIHFIRDWNQQYFEPPLKDSELLSILKSITTRDNKQRGVKQ